MPTPPSKPSPSRWFRKRNVIALGVLAGIVLVALLPKFVASRMVVNLLLARLLSNDLRAEVGDVSLGWFSPLRIEGLEVDGNPGGQIFRIEKIETRLSLTGLLTNRKQLGSVDIEQPTVNLTVLEEGTNFQALIKALTPTDRSKEKKTVDAELEARIRGLRLDVRKGEKTKPLLATSLADFSLFYSVIDDGPQLSLDQSAILDHAVITIHAVGVEAESPLIKTISSTLSKILRGPEVTRVLLVDGSAIRVTVENRLIRHEGVRFGLPQIDPELVLETSGTIGFDRSLELILKVPVPMKLLLSNPGQFAEGTSKIRSFSIPVRGTIDEPIIEWSAKQQDEPAVGGKEIGEESSDASAEQATGVRRRLGDLLRKRLRGSGGQDK